MSWWVYVGNTLGMLAGAAYTVLFFQLYEHSDIHCSRDGGMRSLKSLCQCGALWMGIAFVICLVGIVLEAKQYSMLPSLILFLQQCIFATMAAFLWYKAREEILSNEARLASMYFIPNPCNSQLSVTILRLLPALWLLSLSFLLAVLISPCVTMSQSVLGALICFDAGSFLLYSPTGAIVLNSSVYALVNAFCFCAVNALENSCGEMPCLFSSYALFLGTVSACCISCLLSLFDYLTAYQSSWSNARGFGFLYLSLQSVLCTTLYLYDPSLVAAVGSSCALLGMVFYHTTCYILKQTVTAQFTALRNVAAVTKEQFEHDLDSLPHIEVNSNQFTSEERITPPPQPPSSLEMEVKEEYNKEIAMSICNDQNKMEI